MAQVADTDVRVVVGEGSQMLRESLKGTLFAMGFRNIVVCKDAETLLPAVAREIIDLLLCDVELSGLDFLDFAHRIRIGGQSANPFVVVVATIGENSEIDVKALVDTGIDDLIRKPLTADTLRNRVHRFLHGRRPFVATENYVGPDRRATPRDHDRDYLMEVPNTLRRKMVDRAGPEEIRREVVQAAIDLGDARIWNSVLTIHRLLTAVIAYYEGKSTPADGRRDIEHLNTACEDLARRHKGTRYRLIADLASGAWLLNKRMATLPEGSRAAGLGLLYRLDELTQQFRASRGSAPNIAEDIRHVLDHIARGAPPPHGGKTD